jgi:hypothetical protein
MCQRWGGGPLLSVHCGSELSISGLANVYEFANATARLTEAEVFGKYAPPAQ